MTKKELINAVCNRAEINRTEFEHGFNNLIEVVKETIAKGEPIYVREAGENPAIKELLINLFGKEIVEPEQPKDVRERIKTFEDAYHELGCEHPFCKAWDSIYQGDNEFDCDDIKDIIAYHKLRIIVAALNEGWKPEFTEDEYRYYPYYFFCTKQEHDNLSNVDKRSCRAVGRANNIANVNGDLVFAYEIYTFSASRSYHGSRLAFKNRELAEYAGQQFFDIYKDFVA